MMILVKPELENAIVVADLQMVMANFGIQDEDGPSEQASPRQPEPTDEKKPKSKFDFGSLTDEALSCLYEIAKWA
jgi:hypothetical protein